MGVKSRDIHAPRLIYFFIKKIKFYADNSERNIEYQGKSRQQPPGMPRHSPQYTQYNVEHGRRYEYKRQQINKPGTPAGYQTANEVRPRQDYRQKEENHPAYFPRVRRHNRKSQIGCDDTQCQNNADNQSGSGVVFFINNQQG